MPRAKAALLTLVAATVATWGLAACSGDDTNQPPAGDGGSQDAIAPVDGMVPPVDGNVADSGQVSEGGNTPDGGDGGPCDFNAFVIGLIQNHTNGTDLPSTDLGQSCVDTQTTMTGAPLFP